MANLWSNTRDFVGKFPRIREAKKHFELGFGLHFQGNFIAAEQKLRLASDEQEKLLGNDHWRTLLSKSSLGRTLLAQERPREAEQLLQHVADVIEKKNFDSEYYLRRDNKLWLGRTLHAQRKYSEAEQLFQELADAWEKKKEEKNKNKIDTHYDPNFGLHAKLWLGRTLVAQNKYSEAEQVLRQTAVLWEQTDKHDDRQSGAASGRFMLGKTLYFLERYREAVTLLQTEVDWKKARDKDDRFTTETKEYLQLAQKALSREPSDNTTSTQTTLGDLLNNLFPRENGRKAAYNEDEIENISRLLKQVTPRWSKVPRTYIVLRTIGHLSFLDDLIDVGFSDYWFPVTEGKLPGCLTPSVRAAFFNTQYLVLTRSLDLENGPKGRHCYFKEGENIPLEAKEVLGRGGFGQVDKVVSLATLKEYARKRVPRSVAFKGRKSEQVKQFIAEIEILKRLRHNHMVEFVGSYTDPKFIGLIMSPVAEMDLKDYLSRATVSKRPELRTYFGCLATALQFLHEAGIRHKDIKPGNILVNRGTVLLADFGLSLDFSDASGSTTTGMVNGMTARYCSPEVSEHMPRNTKSDIWSLGVVFAEMVTILKGKTIQDMNDFFNEHGSQLQFIRTNMDALAEYSNHLEGLGESVDNIVLRWIRKMLVLDHRMRPSAYSLVEDILASGEHGEGTRFCGICCAFEEEGFSDSAFGDE